MGKEVFMKGGARGEGKHAQLQTSVLATDKQGQEHECNVLCLGMDILPQQGGIASRVLYPG